jgi:hypothetical protein
MADKTKDGVCVVCTKPIKVHKFVSLKTCKCDDCKTNKTRKAEPVNTSDQETAYGESTAGPRIDGKPNKALMKLCCPYHPADPMDIVGVIKNDKWGDIVSFQCRERGCHAVIQITEQAKMSSPWRTTADGTSFEPDDLIETLRQGKMEEWCDERGIEQKQTTGL